MFATKTKKMRADKDSQASSFDYGIKAAILDVVSVGKTSHQ